MRTVPSRSGPDKRRVARGFAPRISGGNPLTA
jgi:hypothetical protein